MRSTTILAVVTLVACGDQFAERRPGERAPLTAACDDNDPVRCLLPWPSNTFAMRDDATATGLRLAVERSSLPKDRDDPWALNVADGFSRVTPMMTAFEEPLSWDDGTAPVRLFNAQPGHPAYGQEISVRLDLVEEPDATLLLAFPLEVLAGNADHVVAVTRDLRTAAGDRLSADEVTRLALGRTTPETDRQEQLAAYHAPTRALLRHVDIDSAEVVRVWEFTTRSDEDATAWLADARARSIAAVKSGAVTVVIDEVESHSDPAIAAVVEGRLDGLPRFVEDERLWPGEGGLAVHGEVHAPFRIVLPAGSGDYRVAMYGHGTGGNVQDVAFDQEIARHGMAKVGIQFSGWTGDTLMDSLFALDLMIAGTHESSAGLLQSLAHGVAIQAAMSSVLGDALAAPTLAGETNPVVGRRPDGGAPMWVGGSLAGTMGLTYASVDAELRYAVINVPGAAWTHWMRDADLYLLLEALMETNHGGPINMAMATMLAQGAWDPVDGAVFDVLRAASPTVFLIQECMGDPILPNPGSEIAAVSVGAVQVGGVLAPIFGVQPANEAINQSAITQYRVAATDKFEIHGFAARNAPAGRAAREQITDFFESIEQGVARITVPASCAGGSCDFSMP